MSDPCWRYVLERKYEMPMQCGQPWSGSDPYPTLETLPERCLRCGCLPIEHKNVQDFVSQFCCDMSITELHAEFDERFMQMRAVLKLILTFSQTVKP